MSVSRGSSSVSPWRHLRVFLRMDWWLVLLASALILCGLLFIHSATSADVDFRGQHLRQVVFLLASAGTGLFLIAIPYARVMRGAWLLYGLALLSLLALPFLGPNINGAVRWFRLAGVSVQPSEFTKLAVIIVLAAYLRLRHKARTFDGLVVPILITAVPALLIMRQPDLGSSLVLWPVLLAMCYAAGVSGRALLTVVGIGLLAVALGGQFLRDYQMERVAVWLEHFGWPDDIETAEASKVKKQLLGAAYQPWQSLIAVGGGGTWGFGYMQGPQSQFDFLPYRNADYIFSVVAEELGFVGACSILGLYGALIFWLLRIAGRTRERFGRLLVVGVATYLGTQSLLHVAVCIWLVPATGLPMPLISYGGSSTMAAVLALALALNVSGRRQPVLSGDGYT